MSILTAREIMTHVYAKRIIITPFIEPNLGPNSLNLTLADELKVYDEVTLDCKFPNRTRMIQIPEEGLVLQPKILYLGKTVEWTETPHHVPMIEGRSSFARLGMAIHVTGGFGDIGFKGCWTLEIVVTHPLRIYQDMKVCQIFYHEPVGPIDRVYQGKYQNDSQISASKIHEEF